MRLIWYGFLTLVAVVVMALSVANRHVVMVYATPDFTAYGFGAPPRYELPLFAVALAAGAAGLLLGIVGEYLRESRYRRRMTERGRRIGELKREVEALRADQKLDEDDEIIALTSR